MYTLFVNDETWGKFAVNLLDADESNISQRGLPKEFENVAEVDTAYKKRDEQQAANRELWGYAAVCALVLLVVEWWLYHRNL